MLTARCPQCRKKLPWKGNPFRPFCSERCKMIDLGKWVTDEYKVQEDETEGAPHRLAPSVKDSQD